MVHHREEVVHHREEEGQPEVVARLGVGEEVLLLLEMGEVGAWHLDQRHWLALSLTSWP